VVVANHVEGNKSGMRIGIIGTGYVGLIVGAVLASNGNAVVGYDVDHDKIEALNRGEVGLHEPGPEALVLSLVHI